MAPNQSSCALNGGLKDDVFLTNLFDLIIKDIVKKSTDVDSKVVEFHHPKELKTLIDLDINNHATDNDEILSLCSKVIQYSVKTGHPHFFNQLFSGLDVHGLAGNWLSEALNTSQYTYEVAPVFTLMETVVIQEMCKCIGFPDGDGIFCPGGSMSNMSGLNVARFTHFPQVKQLGMQSLPKLVIFTSEQSHYSLKKGAALLGFGMSSLRMVKCDSVGRMNTKQLECDIIEAKEQGFTPFFVNATSGTTVLGAYDDLQEISAICKRHNLWVHVDACWGGGALLTDKYRYLMKGVENVDSISWNPHKMMGAPLQCAAFITKEKGILQMAHSANATYLFQQDKFYDVSYDTGDKSLQCGRKVDVLKIWMMWKSRGRVGFSDAIVNVFERSRHLAERIRNKQGFRIVLNEPQCTNVCFWYIPPSMRNQTEDADWWSRLGKIAPALKEQMVLKGSMMIGFQPLGERVNFFRVVVSNLELTDADMDYITDEIERCAVNM